MWAEALQRNFAKAQSLDPACQCRVLIDPAIRDVAQDPVFIDLMDALGVQPEPIRWEHRHLNPAHRPQLITLDLAKYQGSELLSLTLRTAADDAAPASLQQALGQRIAGWFFSAADTRTLTQHLGALAVQALPQGLPPEAGHKRFLRFYDSLVWPTLWALSDDQQRTVAMGPIQQWFWWEQSGELASVTRPASAENHDTSLPAQGPLNEIWRASQWRMLVCLGAFNPAAIEAGMTADLRSKRPIVLRTLERILQWGVWEQTDLCDMARLAIKHHPEFDRHPKVSQLLAQRAPDRRASFALSELTPAEWQLIGEELNTPT